MVLNLDAKILVTAICLLINDESTRVGTQVSRNGAEPTAHNLGLFIGIQKCKNFITPSHRGKEAVAAVARENNCL